MSDVNRDQKDYSEGGMDFVNLMTILWRFKFRIIFVSALITAVGMKYIFSLPKVYTASSTVMLGDSTPGLSMPFAFSGVGGGSDEKLGTYKEFIRSRQFLGTIVDELDLTHLPLYRPKTQGYDDGYVRDYAIGVLLRNLTLSTVGSTSLLTISVESLDPVLAADIANHIGPSFFTYHRALNRERADSQSVWLSQQLESLQADLRIAEENLQEFLEQNQLMDVKSQIALTRTEISTLLQEKLDTEKKLSVANNTFAQLQKYRGDYDELMRIPWVLESRLIMGVREKIVVQEQVIAEVEKRYKHKHHRYIAAKSKLDALHADKRKLLDGLVDGFFRDHESLLARLNDLSSQIVELKRQHSDLGTLELELNKLHREVMAKQTIYESYLARLQETEMRKDLTSADNFAVVDRAFVPLGPTKPRVAVLSALLVIFSVLLSCAFWLLYYSALNKESRCRQILVKTGVPLLVKIPKVKRLAMQDLDSQMSGRGAAKRYAFSETIRSLRSFVTLDRDGDSKRVIAITGVGKKSGTTSVSINLAKSLSKLERSLLIDANLRDPGIQKGMSLSEERPGLCEFIDKECHFNHALHIEPSSKLHVLACKSSKQETMLYLSKPRFHQMLKKLGVLYERVIIETPPVNSFSDVLHLTNVVDGIILVCDPDATEPRELRDSIVKLQDIDAPLLGVVFNKVKHVRG